MLAIRRFADDADVKRLRAQAIAPVHHVVVPYIREDRSYIIYIYSGRAIAHLRKMYIIDSAHQGPHENYNSLSFFFFSFLFFNLCRITNYTAHVRLFLLQSYKL